MSSDDIKIIYGPPGVATCLTQEFIDKLERLGVGEDVLTILREDVRPAMGVKES